ncbi:MAG: hypothetical protein ABIE68_02400 [bacterium]
MDNKNKNIRKFGEKEASSQEAGAEQPENKKEIFPKQNEQVESGIEEVRETEVEKEQKQIIDEKSDQGERDTKKVKPIPQNQINIAQQNLQQLVNIAFTKGIDEAIDQAKKTDDPYLIDELHDTLVSELYDKLIEAGKLKKD